jgi:hypothetical protein
MALLYGRAGRLSTKNAGFRPGQTLKEKDFQAAQEAMNASLAMVDIRGRAVIRHCHFV